MSAGSSRQALQPLCASVCLPVKWHKPAVRQLTQSSRLCTALETRPLSPNCPTSDLSRGTGDTETLRIKEGSSRKSSRNMTCSPRTSQGSLRVRVSGRQHRAPGRVERALAFQELALWLPREGGQKQDGPVTLRLIHHLLLDPRHFQTQAPGPEQPPSQRSQTPSVLEKGDTGGCDPGRGPPGMSIPTPQALTSPWSNRASA